MRLGNCYAVGAALRVINEHSRIDCTEHYSNALQV